jgi:hypothetical protein
MAMAMDAGGSEQETEGIPLDSNVPKRKRMVQSPDQGLSYFRTCVLSMRPITNNQAPRSK